MMRRFLAALGLTTLMLGAGVAAAQDNKAAPDNLEAVQTWLDSTQFMVSRTELMKVDPEPVPELIALAKGKKTPAEVRERAIKSLSLFRGEEVQAAFKDLLKQHGKGKLYMSVAFAYLEAFGEDAVPDLAPNLQSKDADIRATTARGFGIFGGQSGYDLLKEHRPNETDERVLQAMRPFVR